MCPPPPFHSVVASIANPIRLREIKKRDPVPRLLPCFPGGGGGVLSMGGGGGGTLICSYIRRLGTFFGVQNFELQYILGFFF